MTTNYQIDRLLTLMQRLRDPENGCPWDKEQTFASIAPYTLEETYEVLDAIAREDFDDLRGELGDLLFQVVFYAQMAQEEGRFDFNDICAAISDKLERRHPHVFGELSADNSEEVLARWEQIKTEERAQKAQHSALDDIPRSLPALMRAQKAQHSALDDIPRSLPALMRAQKIQKRCSNVGFDWTTLGPVVGKVYEEIDEVMFEARQAVVDQAKLEEEMGDLLFATVNMARHLGTKAELALQKANDKFERRFREVERIVAARGLEMTGVDLETMEEVWQEVKRQEIDL
ncbi:nucleoside triphosphate pyrophosphohydrolase [Salmonella enterica]|nr:nucleoside triphosphate pyrophosphohydrolase [Salmonella enterica]EAU2295936.1 nucleoside triphosphate pyrophosphohydrolase [Salmonella enterica]